jgi:hypothetical protein
MSRTGRPLAGSPRVPQSRPRPPRAPPATMWRPHRHPPRRGSPSSQQRPMKERGAASIDSPNLGYSAHSHPPGGLQNYYRQNVIGGLMPLCWSNGRKPMRPSLDASFLVLFSFAGELRAADVDLEVILSADVSRSIDDAEFKLQRKGYAAAFERSARLECHSWQAARVDRRLLYRMVGGRGAAGRSPPQHTVFKTPYLTPSKVDSSDWLRITSPSVGAAEAGLVAALDRAQPRRLPRVYPQEWLTRFPQPSR